MNAFKKATLKLFVVTLLVFTSTGVMAQSNNTLTGSIIAQERGDRFSLTSAPRIKIDLKEFIKYDGQPIIFYVNLKDAKWLEAIELESATNSFSGATFKIITDTKLEVSITKSLDTKSYSIPLLTELTGSKAQVSIDGGTTGISSMEATLFAVASDQKAIVSVQNIPGIREEGFVANIKIDELVKGSLVESQTVANRTIKLKMLHQHYIFENDKPIVTPSMGFAGISGITTQYGQFAGEVDKEVLNLTLPNKKDSTLQGTLNISELKIKATSKELALGDIQIQVSGPNIEDTIITVAQIKDYGFTVVNSLNNPVQIIAGSNNKVSFSIKENAADSLVPGKTVQVLLDKGYFAANKKAEISSLKGHTIKVNAKDVTQSMLLRGIYENEFLVGFEFEVPTDISSDKTNEIKFDNIQVYAPINAQGNIQVIANVAGLKDDARVVVADIKTSSTVTTEPIRLKVGVANQVGGKITIAETDKGMIRKGTIEVEIGKQDGIRFLEKPSVTVIAGDLQIGNIRYDEAHPNILKIEVVRTSMYASSIQIKDFVVTTDGTVPDGSYKLTLKGDAITSDPSLGGLEYNNFMIVGDFLLDTAPIQVADDQIVSKFIIGSQSYDVNGEKRTMDAKAYIEAGRTMVPVRYVADAIGITSQGIRYENHIVTISTSEKTIMLYEGQNKVHVNAEEMLISGKVVIKEGRTYVPVAEIARILGIKVTWEPATKMATFEK